MTDFTNCPIVPGRAYNGANGSKIAVEYGGGIYMLKFPPSGERKPTNLSYTNSCISEHLASSIFNLIGINAQKTELGTFSIKGKTKVVCACKDFATGSKRLFDFCSIKNTILDSDSNGSGTELEDVMDTIDKQQYVSPVELREHFWNVFIVDAAQMQRIQDTFWAMHEITYEVEEVDTTPEPTEDDPDPEQQTDYILHITVSSKTVDELAELYNFTQDQKDILHQLLSEEMRPSLLALCGGIAVADGELCWPLPGHTYISCHFGEVDAFGNAGHRGTDIPAPEGTPILAAHSGTVLVSGWNDSYGNQVLLDNGAGLSTRYAHMTQTAVTAGEAVTAGQIIGYVGSTGDSTGNHLHFEVMQNGVRMNPLELVFAQ